MQKNYPRLYFLLWSCIMGGMAASIAFFGFEQNIERSLTIGFLLMIYCIPSSIAGARNHSNEFPITLTNLLLGWSLVGWIIALIWATTDNTKKVN